MKNSNNYSSGFAVALSECVNKCLITDEQAIEVIDAEIHKMASEGDSEIVSMDILNRLKMELFINEDEVTHPQ